jgi:hypothetical protein
MLVVRRHNSAQSQENSIMTSSRWINRQISLATFDFSQAIPIQAWDGYCSVNVEVHPTAHMARILAKKEAENARSIGREVTVLDEGSFITIVMSEDFYGWRDTIVIHTALGHISTCPWDSSLKVWSKDHDTAVAHWNEEKTFLETDDDGFCCVKDDAAIDTFISVMNRIDEMPAAAPQPSTSTITGRFVIFTLFTLVISALRGMLS